MGHMSKKHHRRVVQLEEELTQLEAIKKPRLKIKHRIATIKNNELPKARLNKDRV